MGDPMVTRIWLLFCLLMLLSPALLGHNCSGPGDCEETGGYIAGVTTVVSIIGTIIGIWGNTLGGLINSVPPTAPPTKSVPQSGTQPCSTCGQPVPDSKKFCPFCGAKQQQPETTPPPKRDTCPKCGDDLPLGSYCPRCAARDAIDPTRTGGSTFGGFTGPLGAPPVEKPDEKPEDDPTHWAQCPNCNKSYAIDPDDLNPGLCPFCSGPVDPVTDKKVDPPPPEPPKSAQCPKCQKTYLVDPDDPGPGMCPFCQAPVDPSKDSKPVEPPKSAQCPKCQKTYLVDPNDPGPGMCPFCQAPVDPSKDVKPPQHAQCPNCSRSYQLDPDDLSPGLCPFCSGPVDPSKDPKPKRQPLEAQCAKCNGTYFYDPDNPATEYCPFCKKSAGPETVENWCPKCGKQYQSQVGQDMPCPHCAAADAKPTEVWCGKCSKRYTSLGPSTPCPHCSANDPRQVETICGACGKAFQAKGAEDRCPECAPNDFRVKEVTCPKCSTKFLQAGQVPVACPRCTYKPPKMVVCDKCGATYQENDDGRPCPTCHGAGKPEPEPPKKEEKPVVKWVPKACPTCGKSFHVPEDKELVCPDCSATPPTPPPATTTAAPPPPTPPAPPAPPEIPPPVPPATAPTGPLKSDVFKGDQAAQMLEQAGLAKVDRDAAGNITGVREAFPGAFSNPGGQPVTVRTGEMPGDAANPTAWVSEAGGKITGIAFPKNPDGSLGQPVVVVEHEKSEWKQVQPPTPGPLDILAQQAKDAAAQAAKAASDAAAAVQKQYQDVQNKMGLVDLGRGAYTAYKLYDADAARAAVQKLATDLKVSPQRAQELMDMDAKTWEGLKAGAALPGTIADAIKEKLGG